MILFSDANGTIQANFGTPVYQGSANSNAIYLIAPYAPAASVMVGFQLPDGTAVAPVAMTPLNAIPGVQNAGGTTFAGWSYVLPATVTAKYGTVTAQFFFYAPTGQSANPTSIIATSATSFQIGRGAATVLPDTPDADVYESILSNLAQLQTDLNGGYYGARAIFPWSNGATYGANEITFYPSIGTYGAFVQSVVAGNTNNAPYVNGAINSAYWSEVVNFNTIAEDYFNQVQAAVAQAESAASEAESSAQAAAGSATQSAGSAAEAAQSAQAAQTSAEAAQGSANDAAQSAEEAATSATQAQNSATQSGTYAGNAQTYAQNAANSATEAQGYADYTKQLVDGLGGVYIPQGSLAFASLPTQPAAQYQGYVWNITDAFTTDSRFLEGAGESVPAGANVACVLVDGAYKYDVLSGIVDLSNYAQINGTYSGMTVGKATNADNATKATQDASGNVITTTYATKAENNAKYTKPSTGIPKTDLASAVQASLGKADSAYQKPSTGIPKGDLASAVQTSLNKADTALQSIPIATQSAVGGVKPVTKTSEMTQSVGVDSNGALWTKEASEGTTVVANPTATGTQDLTSLQVGGTVYNIPQGGAVEYATDEEIDALFEAAEPQDELIGTWVFNDTIDISEKKEFIVTFTVSYPSFNGKRIQINSIYHPDGGGLVYYGSVTEGTPSAPAYNGTWENEGYKTIQITDISALTNREEFETWLKANATKQ